LFHFFFITKVILLDIYDLEILKFVYRQMRWKKLMLCRYGNEIV